MGGEITNSWLIPWELMNSSKVNSIRVPVKWVDLFRGLDFSNTGGAISLGPPLGDPIFAHCAKIIKNKKDDRI